jgi:quinoprotein glucose dehydrogenase
MLNRSSVRAAAICAAGLLSLAVLPAAEIGAVKSDAVGLKKEERLPAPQVAPASKEAESALKRLRAAPGLKVDLWAAEPMLANPVAFCLDEQGRVFVSETHRYRTSVLDIRHYMFMLEDDLAARTVDDRIALSKKWFGKQADDLAVETEVVRLVRDSNGDGKADQTCVYADGFNTMLDGIASGTLARKGKVYFANIPNVWELSGLDANGRATSRKSMSYGYGVRYSFTGHDLHGLAIGPDAKLYFSLGDRGATIKTMEGKTLSYPDEGAVFRCNLDGSDLEVVYRGLRNPQELVFDDYGNLFTGDNDFDHGDEERLVYIVEGGDSGWRVGYQHAPLGYDLVAWKSEHIWINHESRQADYNGKELKNRTADTSIRPAAYLKPISNIGDGPSGFAFNPGGVALPAKYDGKFFLTHFKGAVSTSKIQTFRLKPDGAGFKLADSEEFITQGQPTDVDFGPDGAVYFSDWGEGWDRTKKGRIYRVYDEKLLQGETVLATKQLIGEGMEKRSTDELAKLLGHRDRRVRQEAQFELVARKEQSALAAVATDHARENPMARLHAIWGLGVLGRANVKSLEPLERLIPDNSPEVRAQVAKVMGDCRWGGRRTLLWDSLRDSSPRVRFFAAMALGKIGGKDAMPAVIEFIRANNNQDQFLRHAGVMALAGIKDISGLKSLAKDRSPAVRLAAVVALRKLEAPEVAAFLNDTDPAVVIEAVRAINDAPINKAMPQVAALLNANVPVASGKWSQPFLLRAINANFRTGDARSAKTLAQFAMNTSADTAMRVEALEQLSHWGNPPARDRILGIYRPLAARSATPATDALRPVIAGLLRKAPDAVRASAAKACDDLGLKEAAPVLLELVKDTKLESKVRVAALDALAGLKDTRLNEALDFAQKDADQALRRDAAKLLGASGGKNAFAQLSAVLGKGSVDEQQAALASISKLPGKRVDELLVKWMDNLIAGHVSAPLRLDLLEAAARRDDPGLKERLDRFEARRDQADEMAAWRESLEGGDAEAGRKIFYERADAQCLRCHKLKGEGSEVGPDLTAVGSQKTREYLLEAIVLPNKVIAQGFDSVSVVLKDEQEFSGVLKGETAEELTLAVPGLPPVKVKKADIASRRTGLSGMPEGFGQLLSKRDLRDLLEFLATQK